MSCPKADSSIKNSFELVDKLVRIEWEQDYKLLSLDVVSLFTNVPLELALDSISNRWEYISQHTLFTQEDL